MLIEDSIADFQVDKESKKSIDPRIENFFKECFKFLKHFCYKNEENQAVLAQDLVIYQLNMASNFGQVELICEIFRNNPQICIECQEETLDDFVRLIQFNGRRASYLEIFEIVQRNRLKYIKDNQIKVLNVLLQISTR